MTLYDECLTALGDNTQIMSDKETTDIFETMTRIFPITSWGRVDWDKVAIKMPIHSIHEVVTELEKNGLIKDEVYIIWDEASLPAIKTNIRNIINIIYDVTAVSFDTWIFCLTKKYLIEFYHENEITLGFGE